VSHLSELLCVALTHRLPRPSKLHGKHGFRGRREGFVDDADIIVECETRVHHTVEMSMELFQLLLGYFWMQEKMIYKAIDSLPRFRNSQDKPYRNDAPYLHLAPRA